MRLQVKSNKGLNMKNKIMQLLFTVITCVTLAITISSCNNNAGSGAVADDVASKIGKLKSSVGIGYTLDGEVLNASTQNWADMGWHLLTLTMNSAPVPQQSIPVGGVGATIGTVGHLAKYGESVVVQDVNCNNAVFANVGDTCSAYIKVSYDYKTYSNLKPIVIVNIYPNNWQSLPVIIQTRDWIQPAMSVGIYRPVLPIETEYYSGSQVASNQNQYRILMMQNGLINPLSITAVATPSAAQIFKLIHRSVIGNDPYYGNNSECATTANSELNQVNTLPNLNSTCIVVYKATLYTTQANEYNNIYVGSTANSIFPQYAGNYQLHAHYAVANPIPNQGFTTNSGAFPTPEQINQFNISYNFTPNRLPIIGGSNGAALVLPAGTNVWGGEPILTNLGAPRTIASVNEQFPDGEVDQNGGSAQSICQEAPATASGQVYQTQGLTGQGLFNIAIQINSYAHCGSAAPQNFSIPIPFSGYSQQIYAVDQQGCGGGNWDIGAFATLEGSCDGTECNYTLALTSSHHGSSGQCNNQKITNIPFNFPQPTTNIVANLNGNNAPINFAAPGGQVSYGKIGTGSGEIAQSITCDGSQTCTASGDYSNGQSALGMSYQINLDPGDVLNHGLVQFTRASGYQLNLFAIQQSGQ